jgi:hypothetical protein
MNSPLWQFWTDFAVKFLGAASTFLAVVVALFGNRLRARFAPSRLVLTLRDPRGFNPQSFVRRADNTVEKVDARWYFARVENQARWNRAESVYIFVLSVEQKDASGVFKLRWKGEMPLRWRHQQDLLPRTIGHPAECDICFVAKTPLALHFQPLVDAGEWNTHYDGPCSLRLTLRAMGVEADTTPLRVEISWDGQWSDDAEVMAQHFVIKEA